MGTLSLAKKCQERVLNETSPLISQAFDPCDTLATGCGCVALSLVHPALLSTPCTPLPRRSTPGRCLPAWLRWGGCTTRAGCLGARLCNAFFLPLRDSTLPIRLRWLTLGLTAVAVRASLLPLSLRASAGGDTLAAALSRARATTQPPPRSRSALRTALASLAASQPGRRLTSPAWVVASPLVAIPVSVYSLLVVRAAAVAPLPGLDCGGAAWFHDLTLSAVDASSLASLTGPTGALLPAATVGLAFAALQRGPMGAAAPPSPIARVRLALEWLLVPTLAAGLCLPAAVFCYALPSAAFSVAHVEAMRARRARAVGEGVLPRTVMRRGAAPLSGAVEAVAPTAAAAGGEAAAPLLHTTAETVSSLPHTPPSPADAPSSADDVAAFAAAAAAGARGDWASAAQLYRAIVDAPSPLAQPSPPHVESPAALALDALSPDARVRRGRALLGLGVALSVSGDAAGAASALAAASAARPGHAQTLVALAAALRAAGRGGEARGAMRAAALAAPQHAAELAAMEAAAEAGGGAGGRAGGEDGAAEGVAEERGTQGRDK